MTTATRARRSRHLEDGETLIRRYHETGDDRLRQRAFGEYMPLARKLARRYHRGREPLEDLEQVAYLGLLKAVDRFDPGYGARFTSFALPTINGELRRHFRDATWAMHAPRWVQEAVLEVSRATDRLGSTLGRAPTTLELAEATGLDVEQVSEALVARSQQRIGSLDRPLADEDEQTLADVVGGEDTGYDLVDHRVTVAPLIAALPAREREVLFLRFAEDMTQSEIARRVGCSQMQVSRLLRRAIARLSQVSDEPQPLPGAATPVPAVVGDDA
jgi:RNA polymerase sigma-B factor